MKKICSKCGIEKDAIEFYKNRRQSDGLNRYCKSCNGEYCRKYHEDNPEKARERARKWQKANPEKVREIKRKWREANLEKERAKDHKRRANNPEKGRERVRKWRENNPEKVRAMHRVSLAKARSELADSYVKGTLKRQFGIPIEEIDSGFIQDKRESIAVKREIRQLKNQSKLQQNG